MPAARIDWSIARNSGQPGDISGVGFLFPSLKFGWYSRETEHPFYAPFYAQWIPATAPALGFFLGGPPPLYVPEASGVTGPLNFSRNPFECNRSTVFQDPLAAGGSH